MSDIEKLKKSFIENLLLSALSELSWAIIKIEQLENKEIHKEDIRELNDISDSIKKVLHRSYL